MPIGMGARSRFFRNCDCLSIIFIIDTRFSMNTEVTKDKLAADLRVVIADAEELLKATASQAGEKVAAARVKIQDSLDTAKAKLASLGEAGVGKAKEAAAATDDFVHEHPWKAVGIGAAIGVIVGMLISRR